MAGLERLRWLVWYINVCGLAPIRMEVDRKTKRFEHFVLSLCHPFTWWFVIVTIAQFGVFIWFGSVAAVALINSYGSLSFITFFTITLQCICNAIILFIPRLLLFYYKDLADSVEYVKKVDEILDQTGQWSCTSRRRIIGGICLTILFVRANSLPYENQLS